jgi:hypothetical protein
LDQSRGGAVKVDNHDRLAKERKLEAINAQLARHARMAPIILLLVILLTAVVLTLLVYHLLGRE